MTYRFQRMPPVKSCLRLYSATSAKTAGRFTTLRNPATPSRRSSSRVETPANVWVDWRCAGHEDISRVGNMSLGGLFIETRASKNLGSTVKLEFLVQEGQIRADGVVKRVEPGRGLALKFTAVSEQDRPRLAKLMVRLRQSP
jgi:hypothetical protein